MKRRTTISSPIPQNKKSATLPANILPPVTSDQSERLLKEAYENNMRIAKLYKKEYEKIQTLKFFKNRDRLTIIQNKSYNYN